LATDLIWPINYGYGNPVERNNPSGKKVQKCKKKIRLGFSNLSNPCIDFMKPVKNTI
jgi:hypothetical protein